MRQLCILLLGIFFSFGTNLEAQTPFDVAHLTDFENYLKTEIDSAQIAGVEVLIYHNQKRYGTKHLGITVFKQRPLLKKIVFTLFSP